MAANPMGEVIQTLRKTLQVRDGAGMTDAELLTHYLVHHDQTALATLIQRHALMVWGVCRLVLGNQHDVEDAFQATFLVFVRKVASIRNRELLANWLYGVARQTALKARTTKAKKQERERQVTDMPEPPAAEEKLLSDLQPLLDQELGLLPEKYRAVIVLCDLQAVPRPEAARCLGCPEGTVASRLMRARTILAKRLARHGLPVSAGVLAAVLTQQPASAGVPASVIHATIKAASLFAAGQAAGAISLPVATLTEGVLKMMLLKKLTHLATAVILTCLVGLTASVWVMAQTATKDNTLEKARGPQQQDQGGGQDRKDRSNKAMEADLQKLDGMWRLVKLEIGGKAVDPEIWGRNVRREFSGTTVQFHSGLRVTKSEISIDPSKTPKCIDETWVTGARTHGIYELQGDTLRLFLVPADEQRPSEFKTKEGTQQALATYERVKPADDPAKDVQDAKDQPLDPVRAGKVPVVLRVKGAKADIVEGVVFYKADILAVLKNASGQVFGRTVGVCGSTRVGAGLPNGECTIYLDHFNPDTKTWTVLDLNVDQKGVSHVGTQPKGEPGRKGE
jgi:RNA polymerase sigma factor (sigma-70 family)